MDVWEMIADQRQKLADLFENLDESQWSTPSLCSGWTVRDVAGHLIMAFEVGMAKLFWLLIVNGFNFNKMILNVSKEIAQRPTSELVDVLRANAETRWKPPGFGPEAPLADLVIHTQDICRPLGMPPIIDGDKARVILDMVVSRKGRGITKPAWVAGLKLTPDDLDWSWGDGPEIRGTAEAIIMAIGGRKEAMDDLTGPGVDLLRARIA